MLIAWGLSGFVSTWDEVLDESHPDDLRKQNDEVLRVLAPIPTEPLDSLIYPPSILKRVWRKSIAVLWRSHGWNQVMGGQTMSGRDD